MIYLHSYNERFYYNMDSEIDIFIKSYYDLLINLKQMIEEDDHRIDYFTNNIKTCYSSLITSFLSKCNDKKVGKFKSKLDELKEITNEEVFKLSQLTEFSNLLNGLLDSDEEEKIFSLKKISQEFYPKLNAAVNRIVDFSKKKLEQESNWEIITGLTFLQSNMPKKEFKNLRYLLQIEFLKLQEWVKKNNKKLLILFDGRDAAGKGTNIDVITEHLDPKYFRVQTFGIPSKEESKNWFKRYEEVLPKEGEIVFFDRSWYTRMYVEKPMEFCNDEQYDKFIDNVSDFENKLLKDTEVIKIWLSINKEIQKYRFELRKSNPLKYWKFSNNDAKVLDRWNDFTYYINLMVKKMGKVIKWNVVNANDERESTINVMKCILNKFDYEHKDKKILETESAFINEGKNQGKFTLFLDIDGVFISFNKEDSVNHKLFYETEKWSAEAVKNLNLLCHEYEPNVVIISSYAKHKNLKQLKDAFIKCGFNGNIVDKMENKTDERFYCVEEYVKKHNITKYLVIDDQPHDIKTHPEFKKHWCQPDIKKAFTDEDLKICKKIIHKEGL